MGRRGGLRWEGGRLQVGRCGCEEEGERNDQRGGRGDGENKGVKWFDYKCEEGMKVV